ncbi:MAG: YfhO family protein [Clostridia bacterium]|nr:YfhO family protein [Clostridia bacterium]
MNFSKLKATTLSPQKEKRLSTFLIALLIGACLFVPYIILSEGYFTFYGDFNAQQIPFYMHCHEMVRSGKFFWDFGTDLGANFIGSYSFYLLGSPFFWLTVPFPTFVVPYLIGPLLIIKFALCALTGYLYIRRFTRTPRAAQIGALLYAFSGFSVYNIFFNHFHEAFIVFPLLLLSVELFLTENKRFFFALMVCLCAITNYFFFFGMVVFVIIYFFVRLFSKAISVTPARFIAFVFEAVLGLLLSAAILLPAISAILTNSRVSDTLMGWNALMYGKEQIYGNILQCFFFPPDIPARPVFFPGAEVKWSSLGGWLPLFSVTGVFVWFFNKKKNWLKRMIGICIFMALVPILNSAFYAFNASYYARWFYMPILLMCLATSICVEDTKIDWNDGYKWTLGITIAVSLVIGLFPQKDGDGNISLGLFSNNQTTDYMVRYWVACAIAIISLIILGIILRFIRRNPKAFYRSSVVLIAIISIIYGNVFIATGRLHSHEVKEMMIDSLIEGEVTLDGNPDEFRIDVFDGVDNTGMYLGYSSINCFHSVVPASIMDFYEYIGIERSVGSRPDTKYPALRSLLSVKYLLNPKSQTSFVNEESGEAEMYGFSYLKTDGNYYVYENENYVPYGFSYDYYISYDYLEDYIDTQRVNMMLKGVLLSDEQIKKYGHLMRNIEDIEYDYLQNEMSTTLSLTDEDITYDCEQLKATAATSFKTDKNGFTAEVNREKESLVFFSIPYDKGWSATVNGKEAAIEKVNVGFMAVVVPEGDSVIRFNYETPELITGLGVTIGTALIMLIYLVIWLFISRKNALVPDYPEGDEMLDNWLQTELEEKISEANVPQKQSILDDIPGTQMPELEEKFQGGFTINLDIDNKDE